MSLYREHITFRSPFFGIIVGKPNEGKSTFINALVDEMPKKAKIIYVVNSNFKIEPEILERAKDNKNIFIFKAKDLSKTTLDTIIESLKSKNQKLIIVDNFTYQLSLSFLDFTTYSRKYNASTIFIGHTLFASPKISPRLREAVSYIVFFYLPESKSYKFYLGEDLYNVYREEITHESYKFLLWDVGESEYTIGKIPEYQLKLTHNDQFKPSKGSKIQEQLERLDEEGAKDKDSDLKALARHIKTIPSGKGLTAGTGRLPLPSDKRLPLSYGNRLPMPR